MNKYEYKVDSKIIKQLSLYLMLHDIKDFSIEFKSNGKIVQFIIKTKAMKQEIIDYMIDHIRGKRAPEIEVYGWELMGDTESNNELNILGSLIDKIEVNQDETHTEIILSRKY